MGSKATFDPINKIIQMTSLPVGGEVFADVQADLYSDMKEDWRSDSLLNKFRPPISVIGGQPTVGGDAAGDIYFLDAAWKIRPYEADHRFILNGDIFSTDGSSIFTFTVGTYQVLTEQVVSSLVTKVTSGSGLTGTQDLLLKEIHGQAERQVHIDTEQIDPGNGYQQTPYNNFTDAVDYMEASNLHRMILLADAVVDRQIKNFQIHGEGNPRLDFNGQNMDKTTLERMTLTGNYIGTINVSECALVNVSELSGVFLTISAAGTLTVAPNASVIISRVAPAVAGLPWTLDMNSGQPSVIGIHRSSGEVIVVNMDHAEDNLHFHGSNGTLTIDSSCVAGNIVASGGIKVIDNSNGTNVNISTLESEIYLDSIT